MENITIKFHDENTPKKWTAFLEKLIAKTLFELYSTDKYPFMDSNQKADKPHE